jgi:LemA protein
MAYEIFVLIGIIFVAGTIIVIFNRLIQLKERCNDAWSQIDIQLKKRNDLIPNLVELVKGYAKYEKSVFESITLARSGFTNAKTVSEINNANDNMERGVRSLFAVAENYPELKANQSFLKLQDQIGDAEEAITYSRGFYNDTVLNYNNSIAIFPWMLLAKLVNMKAREYFGANDAERRNVEIKDMNK